MNTTTRNNFTYTGNGAAQLRICSYRNLDAYSGIGSVRWPAEDSAQILLDMFANAISENSKG